MSSVQSYWSQATLNHPNFDGEAARVVLKWGYSMVQLINIGIVYSTVDCWYSMVQYGTVYSYILTIVSIGLIYRFPMIKAIFTTLQ